MILSAMHTPSGAIVELRCVDGVYTTHQYEEVEDGSREIGIEDAKDWQRTVRQLASDAPSVPLVDAR